MVKLSDLLKGKKLLVIIFFTAVFLRTLYLLYGSVLIVDDICFFYFEDGIKFLQSRNGDWPTYLSNILNYWIPYNLHVNIQDYCSIVGSIIKSAIITSIFIFLYKFLADAKINKFAAILFVGILYCAFFIYQPRAFIDLMINEGFYRFVLTSCLYVIFLYYCFKIYNKEYKYSIYKLALLAVFVSSSSEFMLFLSILTAPIVFFLSKDKRKKYFLVIFGIILGACILLSQEAFWNNFFYKTSRGDNTFSLIQIISYLPEYTKMVKDKIFIGYLPVFAFILTGTLINLKNKTDVSARRYFKYMCYLFVVSMIFVYSFIFLGKTSYRGNFWLDHSDLYTIFDIIFFTLSVLCVCSLSNVLPKIGNKKIALILLITLYAIFPHYSKNCDVLKIGVTNVRQCIYLTDKMNLFYLYKNIPAKLPPFSRFCGPLWYMRKDVSEIYTEIEITVNDIVSPTETELYKDFKNKKYYPIVYKMSDYSNEQDVVITETTKEALDYFLENGGNFDEVYSGNYKFSDLENKDFVLGN